MKPLPPLVANDFRTGMALQRARGFPGGYWHAHDVEGAWDVLSGSLAELGLDAALLPQAFVEDLVERLGEGCEAAARRAQIAEAVAHVNAQLVAAGSPHRLHAFAEDIPGWESYEPIWMLLTDEERALLIERRVARPA